MTMNDTYNLIFKEELTDEEAMAYGRFIHGQTRKLMNGETLDQLQKATEIMREFGNKVEPTPTKNS